MEREIRFTIPGTPKGKARARTFYNPKLGRMQSITPDNTMLYENLIRTCYIQASSNKIQDMPVSITIHAVFEPPKSASAKNREAMFAGSILPLKKPDIDNIAKVVLDALNGLAYHDDSQIVSLRVSKTYGAPEGVTVWINWEVEDDHTE